MTDKQLKFLIDFKNNGFAINSKQNSDEIDELISYLKSYKIISKKQTSNTLEIVDGNSFEKLLELKSLPEFKKWYSNKHKSIVNNDFHDSTIGSFIQNSQLENSPITNDINATHNNETDKKFLLIKLLSSPWVIGVTLAVLTAILSADRIMDFINDKINRLP